MMLLSVLLGGLVLGVALLGGIGGIARARAARGAVSGDPDAPVVVAIGEGSNGRALDWAAAEASARGCRLHVVHAERLPWAVDVLGFVSMADVSSRRVTGERVVQAAVRRARRVAPDAEVSSELVFGPVGPLLVARGRDAQLLVLGGRRAPFARGVRALLAPAVCDRVAGRARCPVAVVRSLRNGLHGGTSPRIVVGVGGPCAAVLSVAFRAAAQRGLPVTAVHTWRPDVPAGAEVPRGGQAESERRARAELDRALEPWVDHFPGVPVERRLVVADAAAALVRESDGAALTVVGSRGSGIVRAARGSVGRGVAQRSRCPVVVVGLGRDALLRADVPDRPAGAPAPHRPGARPGAPRPRRTPWE